MSQGDPGHGQWLSMAGQGGVPLEMLSHGLGMGVRQASKAVL